jgi:hypothetical protein
VSAIGVIFSVIIAVQALKASKKQSPRSWKRLDKMFEQVVQPAAAVLNKQANTAENEKNIMSELKSIINTAYMPFRMSAAYICRELAESKQEKHRWFELFKKEAEIAYNGYLQGDASEYTAVLSNAEFFRWRKLYFKGLKFIIIPIAAIDTLVLFAGLQQMVNTSNTDNSLILFSINLYIALVIIYAVIFKIKDFKTRKLYSVFYKSDWRSNIKFGLLKRDKAVAKQRRIILLHEQHKLGNGTRCKECGISHDIARCIKHVHKLY